MEKNSTPVKLTEQQMAHLLAFVEKKFVRWYDLKIEIAEQLASSIKIELEADPQLNFEAALERIYKGYGIFGFAKVVQERQLELIKTAKKRWWSELRSMFQWPGMILLLLLLIGVAAISIALDNETLNGVYFGIYVTISIVFFIYLMRDMRIQRRLLLMQSGATYFSFSFIYEFLFLSNFTGLTSVTFTLLLTLGIVIKLASFKLYRKVRSEAAVRYPEIFQHSDNAHKVVQPLAS